MLLADLVAWVWVSEPPGLAWAVAWQPYRLVLLPVWRSPAWEDLHSVEQPALVD